MKYLVIGILISLAACAKALMDASADGKLHGNLNKAESYFNKYKNSDPKQGPKFPGSTTVFVFITDLWHFSQMIFLSSYALAMYLCALKPWPAAGAFTLFHIVFEVLYRKL